MDGFTRPSLEHHIRRLRSARCSRPYVCRLGRCAIRSEHDRCRARSGLAAADASDQRPECRSDLTERTPLATSRAASCVGGFLSCLGGEPGCAQPLARLIGADPERSSGDAVRRNLTRPCATLPLAAAGLRAADPRKRFGDDGTAAPCVARAALPSPRTSHAPLARRYSEAQDHRAAARPTRH